MSTTLKVVLIVFGSLVLLTLILGVGFFLGRIGLHAISWRMPMYSWFNNARVNPFYRNVGPGMMQDYFDNDQDYGSCPNTGTYLQGGGMMGGGWSSGSVCGDYSGQWNGMMWDDDLQTDVSVDLLTIEQAEDTVNDYISRYGDEDLVLAEIMIFDNHAYAEIIEESTGIGAMEVLVDPQTLSVYPEYGPNRMWNQKYGHMGRGMMGNFYSSGTISADMPVSPEDAVAAAQAYLDRYAAGLEVEDHVDPFYGYYTLHIMKNGVVAGMLSVNGYTEDVFIHTWHGDFIEMADFEEDEHE